MANPFLGEIKLFSFNFAPRGWGMCNGQLMAINQNQALFSLLGTTFGGNGITTFGLPNLRSRVSIGIGQGPGLQNRNWGDVLGEEAHAVTINELPPHIHSVACHNAVDNSTGPTTPAGHFWTKENNGDAPYSSTANGLAAMHPSAIGNTGGNQPHLNIQPFLVVNFCIALQGIFPSRN